MNREPHWILRTIFLAGSAGFLDGLILGIAIACVPFVAWLWWTVG